MIAQMNDQTVYSVISFEFDRIELSLIELKLAKILNVQVKTRQILAQCSVYAICDVLSFDISLIELKLIELKL